MPAWKTVHDHDGGELRGHGGAVPHARAGRPVPGLAGPAGPHHLPLPAHAALLVVSILPTGLTACCFCHAFWGARPLGRRHVKQTTGGARSPSFWLVSACAFLVRAFPLL